ncbi:MAG: SusC/RagA family TonB-linked outer membrane protein [Bacteroidia bacterium]|nr:SusC/RagA family TonB-linked outer membrane protein [Bacteroidia bacterium]MDW8300863.1 SusC/RagA family TonB-linked outer membrane protein [Bacteroidia bacterium]
MLFLCLAVIGQLYAQERTITGKITDAEGNGLPGITVLVKGTSKGTASNADGSYSITVSSNDAVLIFSGVGYVRQEIAVGSQSVIDVQLVADEKMLGEVVVTGVAEGTSTKKLGFSIAKIGEKTLKEVPAIDPANAIRGKVAGAQIVQGTGIPGTAPNIRLRGATNIQGTSNPLIIVDGVITAPGTTLADINMNDVESIEIVKGAAGASLYGSQAANGVIQIITKRGAEMEGQTRVTVRSEVGFTNLQRKFPLAKHHHYQLNPDGSFKLQDPNNLGSRIEEADGIADNPYPVNYDQQAQVFKSRLFYNNYVSVASTSRNTNFMVSGENLVTQGVVEGLPAFDRKNVRVNVDHKIIDKLKVSISSLFSSSVGPQASERGQSGIFYSVLLNEPFLNLRAPNPDGTPFDNISPNIYNNATNPLYVAYNDQFKLNRDRLLGNMVLSYQATDWLRLEGQYSLDRTWVNFERWQDKNYITRNFPNGNGGFLQTLKSGEIGQVATLNAYFNKAFLDNDLKIGSTIRYQWEQYNTDFNSLSGSRFASSGVRDASFLDRTTLAVANGSTLVRAENVFLNVRTDYRDRYILEGLVRNDRSSLFGSQERSQIFYRISGAYRLSEDVKIPGIDELKLRASYGTSGQRPRFSDQYETFSSSNGVVVRNQLGNSQLRPSKVGETEVGLNVSFLKRFNFEFNYAKTVARDQILSVPLPPWFGYISQVRNAGTLESNTIEFALNGDALKTKDFTWNFGIIASRTRSEITELGVPPYATDGKFGVASGAGVANSMFRIEKGQPFGVMYGNVLARSLSQLKTNADGFVINLFQVTGRKLEDFEINEDGFVVLKAQRGTTAERAFVLLDETGQKLVTKIGDSNPDLVMGITNTFSYKNFSLYSLLDVQIGGNIYNSTRQLLYFNNRHADLDQSGKPVEKRKPIQYYSAANSIYNGNDPVDYFVEKGGFVIVREINLSYSFDRSFFEKLGAIGKVFYDARIALIGRNLFTFTKYTGYNPEVALADNSTSFRVDQFAYPVFRTYTMSLQLRF